MTPAGLLTALRRHGFTVSVDGAELVCRGPVELTTDRLKANLAQHKAGLLALLAAEARLRAHPLVCKVLATFEGSTLLGCRLPTGEAWRAAQ